MLLFRNRAAPALLLVHPGGPFWAKKDLGAWSIPKGEPDQGEELRAARCARWGRSWDRPRPVSTPAT